MKKEDIKRLSNSALIAACEELGVPVKMDRKVMIAGLAAQDVTKLKFPKDMLLSKD